MELCQGIGQHSHDEVCFDGKTCPVCTELDNIKDKNEEIESLKSDRDDADKELSEANQRIIELEGKLAEKTA